MKLRRTIALIGLLALLPSSPALAKPHKPQTEKASGHKAARKKPTSRKATAKKPKAAEANRAALPPDHAAEDPLAVDTPLDTPEATPSKAAAEEPLDLDLEERAPNSKTSGRVAQAADDVAPEEPTPPEAHKADANASWAFGPYARYTVVPAFMLGLFVDLAPTAATPGFGVTARYRSKADGPMIDFGLGYTSYAFSGAFRSKGGDPNDTEWIESSLGLIHLTASVMWDAPLSRQFAFEYGVGLDFGIVTGEFKRTEAFVGASGQFQKCPSPQFVGSLCGAPLTGSPTSDPYTVRGEQYNIVDKRVPPVMGLPMLPHLALRYAPVPALAVRLEGAYGIAQFWLGLAATYAPGR